MYQKFRAGTLYIKNSVPELMVQKFRPETLYIKKSVLEHILKIPCRNLMVQKFHPETLSAKKIHVGNFHTGAICFGSFIPVIRKISMPEVSIRKLSMWGVLFRKSSSRKFPFCKFSFRGFSVQKIEPIQLNKSKAVCHQTAFVRGHEGE